MPVPVINNAISVELITRIINLSCFYLSKYLFFFNQDQNGIRLTDTEITDEVLTFFLAGQETVATGLLTNKLWKYYRPNLISNV